MLEKCSLLQTVEWNVVKTVFSNEGVPCCCCLFFLGVEKVSEVIRTSADEKILSLVNSCCAAGHWTFSAKATLPEENTSEATAANCFPQIIGNNCFSEPANLLSTQTTLLFLSPPLRVVLRELQPVNVLISTSLVRQLIKPLYLSNGLSDTMHSSSWLRGGRSFATCATHLFGSSLAAAYFGLEQLWLPGSRPLGSLHNETSTGCCLPGKDKLKRLRMCNSCGVVLK